MARSIGGTTRGNLSKWFTLLGNSWLSSSINRVEIVETRSRRTSLCINLRFQRVSRVAFVTSPSRVSRKPLRLHNPALSFTLFTITTKKKLDLNHGLSHRIQEYQPYSPLTGRNIHRMLHRSKKITIASSVIRQKYQPRRSFVNRSKC